jgi:hypothetical protein
MGESSGIGEALTLFPMSLTRTERAAPASGFARVEAQLDDVTALSRREPPPADRLSGDALAALRSLVAALDGEVVVAGNERRAQVTAIAYDADGKVIDTTDAFPPLDCPRNPRELLPRPSSDGSGPHPVTPQEREAMQRAVRCAA